MNTVDPQTPVPNEVKLHEKIAVLKSGKLPQVFRRLAVIGFKPNRDRRYVNSSPEGNIQEIAWAVDKIEDNCVCLFVCARKPFAYATAAIERFAQHRQEKLERELRLAKEYWLRIWPFIKDRRLRGAEFYVADWSHLGLQKAQDAATFWNATEHGKRWPVQPDALVDFRKDEFRKPEELYRDENLNPETLAAIAAPVMQKRTAELTPLAAIGFAHELLLAAQRYVNALPQKRGFVETFIEAFSTVTFAEIEVSNRKSSGQLPLLPPSAQKSKGIPEEKRCEQPLSVVAIRNAVRRYLDEHTPRLTQEQYDRQKEQDKKLRGPGDGQPWTYQQWQSHNQKAVEDCMENSRVSLQDLCHMRWERFERGWKQRQRIVSNRKPPREKPPSSAATSPQTAGRPEKQRAAKVVKKFSRASATRLA